MRSIIVTIRWRDGECEQVMELILHHEEPRIKSSYQKSRESLTGKSKRRPREPTDKSRRRLLPTDRIILAALHKRVPQGAQATVPVRNSELEEECSISRRQVQICLKRLAEKSLIKRLVEETNVGAHAGYQYLVSTRV